MNPRARRLRRHRRTIVARGRRYLALLEAAFDGRELTSGDLAVAATTPAGSGEGMWWDRCDCGRCKPGCPRGHWAGPLVWAAQDVGDVPGLWGLTEREALTYLMPRWLARGITPAQQRGVRAQVDASRALWGGR